MLEHIGIKGEGVWGQKYKQGSSHRKIMNPYPVSENYYFG